MLLDPVTSILVYHSDFEIASKVVSNLRDRGFRHVENISTGTGIHELDVTLLSADEHEPETLLECLVLGTGPDGDDRRKELELLSTNFDGPKLLLATSPEIDAAKVGSALNILHTLALSPEVQYFAEALVTKLRTVILGSQLGYRINRNAQRIARMQLDILKTIIRILESKDPYTRFHSHAVTKWSRMIGRRIGMSEENLTTLGLAAVLHDLGKIGVPDSILNKDTGLTEAEFELMKLHPVIGSDLLAPLDNLADIIPIITHHHERWDGKGYPDGLKGDEIPLMARIIAIADSFNTMRTRRVYKSPMSLEDAVEQIRKNARTQFDPKLAEIMVQLVEENTGGSGRETL